MKKKLIMVLAAFVIALTSFTAVDVASNKAQAKDWKKTGGLWTEYWHSGSFKNYTYTQVFHPYYKGKVSGFLTANGSGSGKIQAVLQQKTSKGWKNVKTFYAKKKGKTSMYYNKASKSYSASYRFKLTNTGTKKTVNYKFMSMY
ncbi:hypothetical protein P9738_04235 [Bacillus siamensis]|uniref:hypothetical protein n=1 Tax=Bacillus siamensis TaxID=659243 RepID=UPI000645794A|nr:hypothetical protein [Bacillus siamensis]MDU0812569.1 hypothetical protein [Bacillus siamensis]MED5046699.1 hypothetical protein [Bacillus siamensis]MED5095517.1 hypothetical protein [Bacillus siamensis]QQD82039.1 hypothetical protein JD965_19700 [Bacillus siamensis]